jgi:transposase, IS6 family
VLSTAAQALPRTTSDAHPLVRVAASLTYADVVARRPPESINWLAEPSVRPMRGLKTDRGATVVITGHAFVQNIRHGHYELGVEEPTTLRVVAAFTELAVAI